MNFRHMILAGLIIFILMAPVFAGENSSDLNNSTKITFEGIEFIIPDGFNESKDSQDFNELGSEGKTCFYINEYGGEIVITVASDWMGMSLDELYKEGASKANINGHEGWNYTEGNLTYFGYVQKDSGIIIGVTNETRLAQVIV